MYQRILVPVDGSDSAWKALNYAKMMGEQFHSELMIVHVDPYCTLATPLAPIVRPEAERGEHPLLNEAKKRLQGYPYAVTYQLVFGHPTDRILTLAEKWAAEMIVLGRRGMSSIEGFLMGSVSSAIAQYAKVPVLIVRENNSN